MGLIEKAIRQAETDRRRERPILRIAELPAPHPHGQHLLRKYTIAGAAAAAMLVIIAVGLVFYEDRPQDSPLPVVSPIPQHSRTVQQPAAASGKRTAVSAVPQSAAQPSAQRHAAALGQLVKPQAEERVPAAQINVVDKGAPPVKQITAPAPPARQAAAAEKPVQESPAEKPAAAVQDLSAVNTPAGDKDTMVQESIRAESALSSQALNNAGLLHLEKGNYQQARGFFEEALRIDPENAQALNNLGLSLYMSGQPAAALPYYQDALTKNPDNIEIYVNLGIALRKLQHYDRSEKMFMRALALNPHHPEMVYNYALLLEETARVDAAEAYFARFLQVAPEHLRPLANKVRIHLQSRKDKVTALK
jgi:tetratricopeptide (TPR) repeat protein